ncbi:MAG: DNA repair protein [Alphaproteobacteria bacterium]|nr:DNA repair protein [Alphaproteobacteria bacterium]
MMEADTLERLRRALAETKALEENARVPLGHDDADAGLKGGLFRGALHEIFAVPGHEGAACGFAAAAAFRLAGKKRVLWIQQEFAAAEFGRLSATGLLELGLDPAQLLLLRVGDGVEALRAASDALGCAALGAVVIEITGEPKAIDLVASRRLTLGAAEKGVAALLLRLHAGPQASTAETRWRIRAFSPPENENWGRPAYEAELLRNRHGNPGRWVMEWNGDDGVFQEAGAPDSRLVVSAPGDRPSAAALEKARCVA